MRRSQKSKRVTWPSDVELCQVKLFVSEECPARNGMGTQDHLRTKALRPVPPGGIWPDDNLPPGFEVIQPANLWRVKLSQIPLTKWRCPPRFVVKKDWQMVAGEESNELETEHQREMRVLEAIYPRPSAIPQNPSVSPDVESSFTSDQNTPIVPTTPIEDDEAAIAASSDSLTANSNPTILQPQLLSHGTSARAMEPDIVVAAQAALTSVMSNSNQEGLIDHNLLMKILTNPKIVEFLINHGASSTLHNISSSCQQNMPSSSFQIMPVVEPQSATSSSLQNMRTDGVQAVTRNMPNLRSPPENLFDPINKKDPLSTHITRPEHVASSTAGPTGSLYPSRIRAGSGPGLWTSLPDATSMPSSSFESPMTKDINYYKSLIQQHGGERRDSLPQFAHRSNQLTGMNREPANFMKSRDQKPKIMKPCIYFNSFKGCRNGNNCAYLHDTCFQQRVSRIPEVQSAKRVKLDREISSASVSNLAFYT